MWETLCLGYFVNLQCEDSSSLPCGWSIAWFLQIFTDILVDNQRNQRYLRENSFCQS